MKLQYLVSCFSKVLNTNARELTQNKDIVTLLQNLTGIKLKIL